MMLKKLLSRSRLSRPKAVQAAPASLPEEQRVYAIGDIHGRLDLLEILMHRIAMDDQQRPPAKTKVIFLGDLVDRGPDSKGVIDYVIKLSKTGVDLRFIAGNHEEIFLKTITEPSEKLTRFFYRIGGQETILSYGIDRAELAMMTMEELTARIPTIVPQSHVRFLTEMEDRIEIGGYLFVHAGIRPEVDISSQSQHDMRWIRQEFTESTECFEKVVIHGHTIFESVSEGPSRIGIDTGAWETDVLTAIGLDGGERWFLDTAI